MKETIEISDNYPIVLNQNDKACQDPCQLLVSYQNNISFRINKCFNMNNINIIISYSFSKKLPLVVSLHSKTECCITKLKK